MKKNISVRKLEIDQKIRVQIEAHFFSTPR